jgi:hypothetical protein
MRKEGKIMVGMLPRLSKIENVGGKKERKSSKCFKYALYYICFFLNNKFLLTLIKINFFSN